MAALLAWAPRRVVIIATRAATAYASNNNLILAWLLSAGRIDDKVHLTVLDEIQDIWAALLQLVE